MNIGDRVQLVGQEQCGIVVGIVPGTVPSISVQWGTRTNNEGKPGTMVFGVYPEDQLEPWPYAVVTADEIAERTRRQREREIHGG